MNFKVQTKDTERSKIILGSLNLKLKLLKFKRSFLKQIRYHLTETERLIVLKINKRSIKGIIKLHPTFWKFNVTIKDH